MTQETINNLKQYFKYERKTGKLLCKKYKYSKHLVGEPVGCVNSNGYLVFRFKDKLHYVHRVVYAFLNGPIEQGLVVDHIDRNKTNNKPNNLRLVTYSENTLNAGVRKTCKSGITGVWLQGKYWRAQLCHNHKKYNVGNFATSNEAFLAREQLKLQLL